MKRFVTIWLFVLLLSSSTLIALDIVEGDEDNTIETEHFIIEYQEGALTIAQDIAEVAETIYPNATEFMDFSPDRKVKITVNHTIEPFYDLSFNAFRRGDYFGPMGYVMAGDITLLLPPPWCTESLGYLSANYYESVFAHEFNHILVQDKHKQTAGVIPMWFVEGLAMYYSYDIYLEIEYGGAPTLLYQAIEDDNFFLLDELYGHVISEEDFNLRYFEGYSIFKYVHSVYGYGKVQEMIGTFETWSQGETTLHNLDRIFNSLFDQNREEFETQWVDWLKNSYIEKPEEITEIEGSLLTNSTLIQVPTSWSDNGILYLDGSNGSLDIYLINENGGAPTRLTYENGTDSDARFSPDGNSIVFTSLRNGSHDLYLMDNYGRGLTRLTNDSSINIAPCWTPDGEKIIFVSDRNGNYDIFTLNLADNSLEPIIVSPYNDGAPSYSPDGKKLAFCSDRSGNFSIYIMNLETDEITKLTNEETHELFPSWSPDGKTISFINYFKNGGLIVLDIDSKKRSIVVDYHGQNSPYTAQPVWSPDGERMCTAVSEWKNLTYRERNLYILDVPEINTGSGQLYLMIGVVVSILIIATGVLIKRKPKTPYFIEEEHLPPPE